MEREDKIKVRAYDIWIAEGCPEGRERDHWEQAAAEIDASTAEGSENSEMNILAAKPPAAAEEMSHTTLRPARRAA